MEHADQVLLGVSHLSQIQELCLDLGTNHLGPHMADQLTHSLNQLTCLRILSLYLR